MAKISKNKAKTEMAIPQQAASPSQADAILQLSAQANSTKQLVDELVNANIGLRSQFMLAQHHMNAATELNSKIGQENSSLKSEIEALKKQISEFEKSEDVSEIKDSSDQDAAA